MGSFSTCEQSQLLLYYSSFKGEKITPFRFVASEQKRTNILFSSHCYSLNSFSYDFIVFLESPLSLPKYSVNGPTGWAGENEKSCFLIYTLFLSNSSDGSYHIWKSNILSQPEYWSIQAYLIQRKKTVIVTLPLLLKLWFKFTTTTQPQDLLAPTNFHFLVVRGRD